MEGVVGGLFVLGVFACPKTFSVESYVPVTEFFDDKVLYGSGGGGGVVCVVVFCDCFDEVL